MVRFMIKFLWCLRVLKVVRDMVCVIRACYLFPRRWKRMFEAGTLENTLEFIENEARQSPLIEMSAPWIMRIAEMCLLTVGLGSRCKCLFRSLMLYYLLGRSRKRVALHFGCRLDGEIIGHCWLDSPDVKLPRLYTKPGGTQEIVARISNDPSRGALWQTSYSQISATEAAVSVLREKKLLALAQTPNLSVKRIT